MMQSQHGQFRSIFGGIFGRKKQVEPTPEPEKKKEEVVVQ